MPGSPDAGPAPRPLLVVRTGSALAPIRAARGDFVDWFAAGCGVPIAVLDAPAGDALPDPAAFPGHYAGVLITGSPAMVSHREAWSERLVPWLRALVPAVPVLGVCYGHQLLAHALGGRVGPNPAGRRVGTAEARLTAAATDDALLRDLPSPLPVPVAHAEVVLEPPAGTAVLATTETDPFHALRLGPVAWGVQFHPEFDADVTRRYVDALADELRKEGQDPERLGAAVRETPAAAGILGRYAALLAAGQPVATGA